TCALPIYCRSYRQHIAIALHDLIEPQDVEWPLQRKADLWFADVPVGFRDLHLLTEFYPHKTAYSLQSIKEYSLYSNCPWRLQPVAKAVGGLMDAEFVLK